MARIHGKKGAIEIDPAGGTTYAAVVSLNKWTLDMATDKVDVTAFGDTNKTYVQGLPDIKGTLSGFYDNTDLTLIDAALAGSAVGLKLIPDEDAPTHFWSGTAFLDASVDVDSNGAVTVSGSFVAAGPWTLAP